jgi:hypothetical protein
MNDLERRTISAAKRATFQRNYRRARDRALVKLAQAYPDQYKNLLEEEMASDKAEGKAWPDLGGPGDITDDIQIGTRQHAALRSIETNGDKQNKGNVGGEK